MFLFLTLLTMTITQGTDNNVHIAFLYWLLKFLCLPLLFGLILVVRCHSKIWGSFIYSADFTQKSIWLWLSAAFNAGLKQAVQCMCSRLFMSEMIHKSEVKMNVNEGFSIFHTADACWHVLIISTNFGVNSECEFDLPLNLSDLPRLLTTSCRHTEIHSWGVIHAPEELR